LNAKIGTQRNIIEYYKYVTDEGNYVFEKIHKETIGAHNNLNVLNE
jgi:hypothetical protein